MRFKLDENLPLEAATHLRHAGHDAATVHDESLSGVSDIRLAATCKREERILMRLDVDFANIQQYPPSEFPGIVVLRLSHQDKPHILSVLKRLLSVLDHEPLAHRLWIVGEERIRISP